MIVQGSFNLDYAILGPASAVNSADLIRAGAVNFPDAGDGVQPVVPFNAMWATRLLASTSPTVNPTAAVMSNRFATSGMNVTFEAAGFQLQVERRTFVWATSLAAGATLYIRGDCGHQGSDQTLNVVARGSGALAGLGIRSGCVSIHRHSASGDLICLAAAKILADVSSLAMVLLPAF